jgi:Tfp pilus assembly protein PilF
MQRKNPAAVPMPARQLRNSARCCSMALFHRLASMRYLVALLVFVTICGPPLSFAQGISGSGHVISGFVREDGSNTLVQGATVEIFASGNRVKPSVMSSTDGEFQFNELHAGDYSIVATKSGYATATMSVAVLLGGSPSVTILLRKSDSPPSTTSGKTISVHQLSVPPKAQEAFRNGLKLLQEDAQPAKSIPEFERAIQVFPSYYEAYTEIAVADYRLNKFQDSEDALKKAIEVSSSKYPDAIILLAELCNDQRRFHEAEPLARRAVALDDSSWHAHFALARALVGLQRGEDAEVSASESRDLKPDNSQVYLLLANAHMLEHRYFAVVQDFDAYLKLEPEGPQSDNIRQRRDRLQQELQNAPPQQPAPSEQP